MYSLGMTIALLIIPELYNCINELAEDCTVKNFHHNFRWESGIVYQSVKEFREALEQVRISKEVSVSELQKKVEDLVFGKLLVDASQRLTSKMLKKELKALTPEIYSEVKEQYKEKVDYCK